MNKRNKPLIIDGPLPDGTEPWRWPAWCNHSSHWSAWRRVGDTEWICATCTPPPRGVAVETRGKAYC